MKKLPVKFKLRKNIWGHYEARFTLHGKYVHMGDTYERDRLKAEHIVKDYLKKNPFYKTRMGWIELRPKFKKHEYDIY